MPTPMAKLWVGISASVNTGGGRPYLVLVQLQTSAPCPEEGPPQCRSEVESEATQLLQDGPEQPLPPKAHAQLPDHAGLCLGQAWRWRKVREDMTQAGSKAGEPQAPTPAPLWQQKRWNHRTVRMDERRSLVHQPECWQELDRKERNGNDLQEAWGGEESPRLSTW